MLRFSLSPTLQALLCALSLCFLVACSGGSDPDGDDCQGADCTACVPLTCGDLGAQCGAISDGCGAELQCGECNAFEVCGADVPNVCNVDCGDGVVDVDETCDDGNVVTEFCEYGEDYYCQVCDRFCAESGGKLHWCGDLKVQADQGEQCDDNNDVEWDGCDLECQKNTCQVQQVYSVTRNELRDLAINGDTLYMSEDKQLTIYDISGATPQQVGVFSDDSNYDFGTIAVHQGHLLVAGRGSHLAIYSLSDPTAPAPVSTVGPSTAAAAMYIDGDRAYLGTHQGFAILDISNLSAPLLLGGATMSANIYSIAASGSAVFVGTTSGVHIYDVTTASSPQLLTTWDPLPDDCCTTNIRGMVIDGNRLYANGGMANLRSLDISNPASPVEIIDNLSIPGGTPGGPVLAFGSDKLVATNSAGVFAVARNGGVLTELLGGYAASSVRSMVMRGDLVYITADNDGFFGSNHYLKVLRVTCE